MLHYQVAHQYTILFDMYKCKSLNQDCSGFNRISKVPQIHLANKNTFAPIYDTALMELMKV